MWQIVLNGIRRMWWLYGIAAIGSIFIVMIADNRSGRHELVIHFSAIMIFFMGIFLFAFETGSFAKFRVHTMLPVCTLYRGRAYSILFAGTVPAINILVYLAGAILHLFFPEWIAEPAPFLWYITVVLFVIGFLCLFLQVTRLGILFPYGWKKAVWELFSVFLLLITLVLAIFFIYRFGVTEQTQPLRSGEPFYFFINGLTGILGPKSHFFNFPDIAALGIAALCIVFTYFKADAFGRYASWLTLQHENNHDDTTLPVNNRAYGFFEPWIRELENEIRITGILVFSIVCVFLLVWFLIPIPLNNLYNEGLTAVPWPFIFIVATGLISIPPLIPWFVALRSLRVLPLSRKSLMFYLASLPLISFVAYSLVLLVACSYFVNLNYALNLQWCLLVVFGFSMIANSLVLLSRHTLITFLALFCPTITAILIFYSYSDPVEAARQMTFLYKVFTGIALLAVGYAGLYVTLAYNLPYRSKPWFG